jgi:KUP system potassium uptake protein
MTCHFYQQNYWRNKFIRSSAVVVSLMSVWHYGESKKQAFELENKVSLDSLLSLGIARVPGICLVCSHVTSGVPPMFAHFVTNFPAFHQILIFVTVQFLMIPKLSSSHWSFPCFKDWSARCPSIPVHCAVSFVHILWIFLFLMKIPNH